MHPQLEHTRTKDDVEQELRDALAIVAELDPPEDLRQLTMQYAVQLISQTAQRVGVAIPGGILSG